MSDVEWPTCMSRPSKVLVNLDIFIYKCIFIPFDTKSSSSNGSHLIPSRCILVTRTIHRFQPLLKRTDPRKRYRPASPIGFVELCLWEGDKEVKEIRQGG